MKTFLVAALMLLSSCVVPTLQNNCGMMLAGDYKDRFAKSWITDQQLSASMDAAIKAASFITDFTFMDQTENCKSLVGYRVYTMPTETFQLSKGRTVFAFTSCQAKLIVVGAPKDGRWQSTSLVHQMYHAMQNCHGKLPVDDHRFIRQQDNEDHANWYRDHIWFAIDEANKEE